MPVCERRPAIGNQSYRRANGAGRRKKSQSAAEPGGQSDCRSGARPDEGQSENRVAESLDRGIWPDTTGHLPGYGGQAASGRPATKSLKNCGSQAATRTHDSSDGCHCPGNDHCLFFRIQAVPTHPARHGRKKRRASEQSLERQPEPKSFSVGGFHESGCRRRESCQSFGTSAFSSGSCHWFLAMS